LAPINPEAPVTKQFIANEAEPQNTPATEFAGKGSLRIDLVTRSFKAQAF
jgi:hypothetical protein